MSPAGTSNAAYREVEPSKFRSHRVRQSLPNVNTTPGNPKIRDDRQLHTIPRNNIRARQKQSVVSRPSRLSLDRKTVDQQFNDTAPFPRGDGTTVTNEPPETSGSPRNDLATGEQDQSARQLSTSFAELDEVDEISVLGIDMPEMMFGYDKERRTPDRFLDDLSFKIESPANFSINELYDEAETSADKISPIQAISQVKVEADYPVSLASVSARTNSLDITGQIKFEQEQQLAQVSTIGTSPPKSPLAFSVIDEADPILGDLPDVTSMGLILTPDKLTSHKSFADHDDIITPARPIEESFSYMREIQPSRTQASPDRSPFMRHRESSPDVVLRSAVTPVDLSIIHDADEQSTNQARDSAESSLGSKHELEEARSVQDIDHSSDLENGTLEAALSPSAAGVIAPNGSAFDEARATFPQGLPPGVATRNVDGTSVKSLELDLPLPRPLGSVITIASGPQLDFDIVHSRELGHESENTDQKRSTPLKDRVPLSTSSVPVMRRSRMHTPPPRKRQSMDVPLSRLYSSLEIWENPQPIIKQRTESPRSPEAPNSRSALKTPSPRQRRSMDVPLARQAEDTEVWNGPQEAVRGGLRRMLASPPARRRSSSTSQLIVDESPQAVTLQSDQESSTARDYSRELPPLPKLDFGVGADFKNARSLADEPSFSEHESLPSELDVKINKDVQVDISKDYTKHSRPQKSQNTPKSSKLRLLARKLAEDHDSSDDMLEPTELVVSEYQHGSKSPITQTAIAQGCRKSPRSPNEILSPRTARRKELSDDIVLDFTEDVELHDKQSTSSPDESEHALIVHTPDVQKPLMIPAAVATPVFTLKRTAKKSPQQKFIGGQQPKSQLSTSNNHGKSSQDRKITASKSSSPVSILKSQLATFGVPPPELPRSRRERKKPTEFWKIQNEDPTHDRPVPNVLPLPPSKRSAKRKHELEAKLPVDSASPPKDDVEAPEQTRPSKKRKRPSDFRGPVSSQHKIVGHSRLPVAMSHERGKPIPRSHNFQDSE